MARVAVKWSTLVLSLFCGAIYIFLSYHRRSLLWEASINIIRCDAQSNWSDFICKTCICSDRFASRPNRLSSRRANRPGRFNGCFDTWIGLCPIYWQDKQLNRPFILLYRSWRFERYRLPGPDLSLKQVLLLLVTKGLYLYNW